MTHLSDLVQDLSLILIAAGVITVLFKFLKQPVVFGYILAGFLIGPFSFVPFSVVDVENIKVWAEIGVIFLLFGIGLEFSFKKLMNVGGAATVTAFTEIPFMLGLGFFTGKFLGWSTIDSLFLGGIISISSTTVILKFFEDFKLKGRRFVNQVIGILVIEDIVAILLIVALTTIAATKTLAGSELFITSLKLLFFIVLSFVFGIFLIPTFIKVLKKVLSDETLLIISLGLCLVMVVLATNAGFSAAFGAFVMGSILAESRESEKIIDVIKPVKNLFGAIFFVSVGMLIDPHLLIDNWGAVLIISAVTVIGKIVGISAGNLIAGQSLRHSIQSSFSMAQIGEFSFIIATLGETLKVTSNFLYPVAVGVSAITTFFTPLLIKSTEGFISKVNQGLPLSIRLGLERYSAAAYTASSRSIWRNFIKGVGFVVLSNSVIVIAIFILTSEYLPDLLDPYIENFEMIRLLSIMAAIFASGPFFWAIAAHHPNKEIYNSLFLDPRTRGVIFISNVFRYMFAVSLISILLTRFISAISALLFAVVFIFILSIFFTKALKSAYYWFEGKFFENLSDKKINHNPESNMPALAPWDAHIEKFTVGSDSELAGKTLQEIGVRENFGVTVVMIERGHVKITAPNQYQYLFPYDNVYIIGSDEQIEKFKRALESNIPFDADFWPSEYSLERYFVTNKSPFINHSIKHSGIREKANGLIVGLERNGNRILNPDSLLTIQDGDILWIVGDINEIRKLT